MNYKELKIGDRVDKKEFGDIDFFEENPRVVKISYQFYDDKSCIATEVEIKSKDYEDILGKDDEEELSK